MRRHNANAGAAGVGFSQRLFGLGAATATSPLAAAVAIALLAGKQVSLFGGYWSDKIEVSVFLAPKIPAAQRDEIRRMYAQTDPHSPGEWRVNGTVANMPEHLREILLLSYFHAFPYKQISDILDIPLGTVKSHIRSIYFKLGVSSRRDVLPG